MTRIVTETATILRQEVERAGAIPFARFMEVALYCPISGYYEGPGNAELGTRNAEPIERGTGGAEGSTFRIGPGGDFYTSVSTGSLFGGLLGCQFARWLEEGGVEPVQLAEGGSHDGQLARDVLNWLQQNRPGLLDRLEYWVVEPSPRLAAASWATTALALALNVAR